MGTKLVKEILHIIFYIVVVLFSAFLIKHFVGERTDVIGISMEDTLNDGDHLILEKVSYLFHNPSRFDIVVFPVEEDSGAYYIKRIIGLPGEKVQIMDGAIYINEKKLEEDFGNTKIEYGNEGLAMEPILVGEDEYFVLGDNRNHSTDSRDESVGNIPSSSIVGKAWIRIWPFTRIH